MYFIFNYYYQKSMPDTIGYTRYATKNIQSDRDTMLWYFIVQCYIDAVLKSIHFPLSVSLL